MIARPSLAAQLAEQPIPDTLRAQLQALRSCSDTVSTLVAIGASTGGPEALLSLLSQVRVEHHAVLISQHMPARFLARLVKRLNTRLDMEVRIADRDQPIEPGHCYLAPGDRHLRAGLVAGRLVATTHDSEPVNGHRPSVNVMFQSVAQLGRVRTVSVLMTGMGRDGAAGLLAARNAGGLCLAQDRHSSVVWGMPGAAVELGAPHAVLPLDTLGRALAALLTPAARR
ncbi:MAG: CheB methylesterase domain-containing protein [Pseudomonadota bacterium]